MRQQKAKGIEWLRDVFRGGAVELLRVEADDFQEALRIYQQFGDKAWSFTDCNSYALMHRLGIESAFSFDEHFQQFGIVQVVP